MNTSIFQNKLNKKTNKEKFLVIIFFMLFFSTISIIITFFSTPTFKVGATFVNRDITPDHNKIPLLSSSMPLKNESFEMYKTIVHSRRMELIIIEKLKETTFKNYTNSEIQKKLKLNTNLFLSNTKSNLYHIQYTNSDYQLCYNVVAIMLSKIDIIKSQIKITSNKKTFIILDKPDYIPTHSKSDFLFNLQIGLVLGFLMGFYFTFYTYFFPRT